MFRTLLAAVGVIFSRPIDLIITHFRDRMIELAMAVIFFVSSIQLVLSPGSFNAGGLLYLSATFNLWTLVTIFFILGVGRIVALILNGHWMPWGAYVRAAGAAIGAVMWLQVDAALWAFGQAGNALPFSTTTYAVLAVFEGISMYRALLGAKNVGRTENMGLGDHQRQLVATYSTPELDRIYRGARVARAAGGQGR